MCRRAGERWGWYVIGSSLLGCHIKGIVLDVLIVGDFPLHPHSNSQPSPATHTPTTSVSHGTVLKDAEVVVIYEYSTQTHFTTSSSSAVSTSPAIEAGPEATAEERSETEPTSSSSVTIDLENTHASPTNSPPIVTHIFYALVKGKSRMHWRCD